MPYRNPDPRLLELGTELRQARLKARLTHKQIGDRMGCSESKLSRMESGTRRSSEFDVITFLAHCGAPRQEIIRIAALTHEPRSTYRIRPHGEKLPDELTSLIVHETTANAITAYEPHLVHGLLQTESYARAVFDWAGLFQGVPAEIRVRARMERQRLLRRDSSPKMLFLLHEDGLRSEIAGPTVMHEQLLRLVLISNLPRCTIRVVPADSAPSGIFGTAFCLIRYAEHKPVVYVGHLTASLFLHEEEHIEAYRRTVARIAEFALPTEESQEWLAALASEYELAGADRGAHEFDLAQE